MYRVRIAAPDEVGMNAFVEEGPAVFTGRYESQLGHRRDKETVEDSSSKHCLSSMLEDQKNDNMCMTGIRADEQRTYQ